MSFLINFVSDFKYSILLSLDLKPSYKQLILQCFAFLSPFYLQLQRLPTPCLVANKKFNCDNTKLCKVFRLGDSRDIPRSNTGIAKGNLTSLSTNTSPCLIKYIQPLISPKTLISASFSFELAVRCSATCLQQ